MCGRLTNGLQHEMVRVSLSKFFSVTPASGNTGRQHDPAGMVVRAQDALGASERQAQKKSTKKTRSAQAKGIHSAGTLAMIWNQKTTPQ